MSAANLPRYMMILRMLTGLALIAGFALLSSDVMRVLTPLALLLYVVSFAISGAAKRSDKRTVVNG